MVKIFMGITVAIFGKRMSILQADQTAEKYRAQCNRDGGTTTSIGRFPNLSQGLVVTKHALTFLFNKYCS
jgi:hypothetical protein